MTSLLQRLQRLIRTDITYLVSGLGWLGSGEIVSYLVGFAQAVAFANLITPAQYGSFQYVQSVFGMLSILALPGLQIAVTQSAARGYEGALRSGVARRFRWSILALVVGLAVGGATVVRGNRTLGLVLILATALFPIVESFGLYSAYMVGRKQFKRRTLFGMLTQILPLAITIGVLFTKPSLPALILAYYLPLAMLHALYYLSITRRLHTATEDAEMLAYGKTLSVFQAVTTVSIWADRFLVFHFLGPAQVAMFSIAMLFPRRFKGLLSIVGDLTFPKWVEKQPWEIRSSLPRKLLLEAGGILVTAGAYALVAPLIFRIFFPAYHSVVGLSQVLILFSLIGISYPIGAFLAAHKRVKELSVLHFGVFAVKIAAFVVLMPKFGLWGAVIATLLEAATNIAISLALLFREKSSEVYMPVPVGGEDA